MSSALMSLLQCPKAAGAQGSCPTINNTICCYGINGDAIILIIIVDSHLYIEKIFSKIENNA
jgi:hypothetical protein